MLLQETGRTKTLYFYSIDIFGMNKTDN